MVDHSSIGKIDRAQFYELYASLKHGPDTPVLEFLAAGGDPNLRSRQGGWTLLHAAAHFGRRRLVRALMSKGADVEAVTNPGFTPLAMAAHSGRTAAVQILLAAGASLDCRPLGLALVDSLKYAQHESDAVRELLSNAIALANSGQSE